MGLVRGNPLVLTTIFFGAAVLVMGGLYATVPIALKDPSPLLIVTMVALGASLVFCLMIVGRIFWVMAQQASKGRGSQNR